MRIIIAEVVTDKDYYNKITPIWKKVFDFKLEFVRQRFSVLNDELLKEENANPNANIKLEMEGETVNDFVLVRGYSDNLKNKIQECLRFETAYFEDKITEIINSHLN